MKPPNDIIALAANGHVKEVACDLDVSLARMYELLGKDNPYVKQWRILRAIGRHNSEGLHLVRADFNARLDSILSPQQRPAVSGAQLHKELTDVVQAHLANKSVAIQRGEIIEAIDLLQRLYDELTETRRPD